MLWFFLLFTTIHILSLSFNVFLFLVVFTNFDHSRIPTVYIYNMVLANCGEIFTVFFIHLLPILLPDDAYREFRVTMGAQITLCSTFCYLHPLYLTILMIVQRISCVAFPMNRMFTDKKLWGYCGGIAIFSFVILIIPYYSDCQINVNQRIFAYEAACAPNRHPITLFQNLYMYLLPVGCMILNIGLILYLSAQKFFLPAESKPTVTVTSMSSIIRRNLEHTLLLQSIVTTTFLLIYELSGVLIRAFAEEYALLTVDTRRFIFYSRISAASLLCFLVYFVGTPSVRSLLLDGLCCGRPLIRSSIVSAAVIT